MALKACTSCQWGLVLCLRVWNTYFTSFFILFLSGINESLKNCESANPFVVVTYRISSNTERWCIIFFNNNFYSWKRENCLDSYKRFVRLKRLTPQQDWTNLILWNRCFSIDFIWQHWWKGKRFTLVVCKWFEKRQKLKRIKLQDSF